MIYRNSYFRKELRQAYIENRISIKRKVAFAFFLGLISFAVHFVLQTMLETVLSDAIPQVMQASYFSTVYTYISIAFFLNVLYFIAYYNYLSFAEIRKNRWYLLVKMGYRPFRMIFSKLIAFLFSIWTVYTIGFLFTVILTVFLKYTFVYKYLPALYLVGIINLIVIGIVFMTASLYIKNPTNARYFIFFSAIAIVVIQFISGYYSVTSDRILMQDFFVLFDFSKTMYLPITAAIVLWCIFVCILRAHSITKYYSMPYEAYGYTLPEEEHVVRLDSRTGKMKPLIDKDRAKLRSKILDIATTTFLIVFICAALAFNIFVILISTSQPGEEVTIRGVIPYIFKSDTMEPTIMENDLAYFRRVDLTEAVNVGEVVLFQEKKVVYVERIISKEDDQYEVDIDYYPPMSQVGAMKKTISRDAIYGVYTSRNRWLGALILFANTIFGRLTFLLVPAFILFFYKPIRTFIENNKTNDDDD